MMDIHQRLRIARANRGYLSATKAAEAMGIPYGTYSGHENGSRGIKPPDTARYAEFFRVPVIWLMFGTGEPPFELAENDILPQDNALQPPIEPAMLRVEASLGARDLPVFAAAEGGDGELVVETEPVDMVPRPWYMGEVKDGYAVIVTGESMIPAYEPGDMAIVNPRLPYMRGKVHIFTCESDNSHFKATIKVLVKVTETAWMVEQHNPQKIFALPKSIWTHARRVVGKYNG